MIVNYIKTAFRNLLKNKIVSAINVGGLVLGISCFLIIFIWAKNELSFDKYHANSGEIYRLIYKQEYDNRFIHSAVSPSPLGPALLSEYPEVVNYTRYSIFFGEVLLSFNENKFYEGNGAYADPGFLDMFSIEFVEGSKVNALKDPYSIILTERMANKYFGDSNPVNKVLYLEGFAELKVTAVIKDIPFNSHLKFDFLVPFKLFEQWGSNLDDWNNWAHQYTYLLLDKKTNKDLFENQIRNYLDKHEPTIKGKLYLQKLTDIHLNTNLNYDNYSDLQESLIVMLFLIVGFVILLIACLNYVNLTTAQYINRTKEAGIRKITGASKFKLISQYLTESLIIAFIAIHISLVIIELIRNKVAILNKYNLTLNYLDFWTIITLFIILIVIGIVSGIFPALFLSSQSPTQFLKSKYSKFKGIISVRKFVVIIQFVLASCLVIVSMYAHKQINFLNKKDLGYNPLGVIAVQLRGDMTGKYNTLKNELLSQNFISHVSYGSSSYTINSSTSDNLDWKGKDAQSSFEVFSSSIDFDYLEMMDIEIVKGRSFSEDYSTDANKSFIINETAARKLGYDDPIGENITFMGKQGQIIGVAKDYHFSTFFQEIDPLIISIRREWRYFLFVKLEKDRYERALNFIESKWNSLNPDFPFTYTFISDDIKSSYLQFNNSVSLILKFTIIAIFIALIGLNALTSYITKSRNKEIGIRKVLGASGKRIVYLLNWSFIKIVIVSYSIAVPISIFIINNWMQIFAYKQKLSFDIFLYSGILIVLLTIIITSFQVIIVARRNPVDSLRYE